MYKLLFILFRWLIYLKQVPIDNIITYLTLNN